MQSIKNLCLPGEYKGGFCGDTNMKAASVHCTLAYPSVKPVKPAHTKMHIFKANVQYGFACMVYMPNIKDR